jgi:hypothetical protein
MLKTCLVALSLTAISGVAASQEYMPNAVLVSFANQTSRVLSLDPSKLGYFLEPLGQA